MSSPVSVSSKEQFDAILNESRTVVASVYSGSSQDHRDVSFLFDSLSETLSEPDAVKFAKVDNDKNPEISSEYSITQFPCFLVFQFGSLKDKVQGTNPDELRKLTDKLTRRIQITEGIHGSMASHEAATAAASAAAESSAPSSGPWRGAELPRGYSDITDQVEIRDCEVLNADDEAGTVRALFETSKPSALNNGKSTAKDWVQSGSDDQLLLYIPFQAIVKLHTLQITSVPSPDDEGEVSRPGVVHLFINRPHNMDFAEADDSEPTQVITLGPEDWNSDGTANISLRFVKFQKTSTLIVYVQQGDGEADVVRVDRVKLIGEAGAKRDMGKLQKVGEDE